jgi:pyruvate formate lyase activating enzyme
VNGVAVDPIEKKPFYHVLPGARTVSFGLLGCNFRCDFCQNWLSSQALKDPEAGASMQEISAAGLAEMCVDSGAPVLTSTYNEPFISVEWAVEAFREARKRGVRGAFVSNGYATREALEFVRPWLDFLKIDLKSIEPATYRKTCGGTLEPVLETIGNAHKAGLWVETVTLVVPGLNDTPAELAAVAKFVASVSRDIPWHVTAFRGQYRMSRTPQTKPETLLRACEAGKGAGLNYVYAGNIPGQLGRWENTWCPSCDSLLVERSGFAVIRNVLAAGKCPKCGLMIPGVWG